MAFLTVYDDENYGGFHEDLNSSTTGLKHNDKLTSFHLAEGRSAQFFVDAHYQGLLFQVPGDYPNDCPGVRPEHNDSVTSIKLFSDPGFANQV